MKLAIIDRLLPGRGTVWVRFEEKELAQPVDALPGVEGGEPQVMPNAPYKYECTPVDYVFWKDVRYSPARCWDEVTWIARRVYMSQDDGIKRFGEDFKQVPLTHEPGRLAALGRHLQLLHPQARLQQQAQRLDELAGRLRRRMDSRLALLGMRHRALNERLVAASPERRLMPLLGQSLARLAQRAQAALAQGLERRRQALRRLAGTLEAVSPLGTQARGYAIVRRLPEGAILRDAASVEVGAAIEARLQRGRLICRVEGCELPSLEENGPSATIQRGTI